MNSYPFKRFLLLISLSLSSIFALNADRRVDCKPVVIVQSGQHNDLVKSIKRQVDKLMLIDPSIRIDAVKEPYFKIHLQIRSYLRTPGKLAAYITYIEPKGKQNVMVMTFPKTTSTEREFSWLSQKVAKRCVSQLRIQAGLNTGKHLSDLMFNNVLHLDPSQHHLSVQLVGSKKPVEKSNKEAGQIIKKLRIKDKEEEAKPVLGIIDRNKFHERAKPPEPYIPPETVKVNPFKAEVDQYLDYEPGFNYPKFRTSAISSLYLIPSLSTHQSDPRQKFSVLIDSFWVSEDFSGANAVETYKFDGHYYGQTISIASRFWGKWNAALQIGWGQRDSETQLDIQHPSAVGGTTFLSKSSLDASLSDTIITINHQNERGKLTFRPTFQVKLPTGSASDIMSSDHVDLSFGFQLEYAYQHWHWASRISFVEAGNLDIFDVSQAEINPDGYGVFSFGIGRTLHPTRGESVSMAINVSQNPMRNVSNFTDLENEIITIGVGGEKVLFRNIAVKADINVGLSRSAPDFGAGITVRQQF